MTSRGVEKMDYNTIGIDISKDRLDVHRLKDGQNCHFANDRQGFQALINWIGNENVRVIFEPTGPWHRSLEGALARQGISFVKVNPRRARRFAEATGTLAKTDRIDAALLAKMGKLLELQPSATHSPTMAELKELLVARDALIKDRTAAKNRGKTVTQPLLKRQNSNRLRHINTQLDAIDKEIENRVMADTDLAIRFDILTSIPGIAKTTAFALIIDMPELGSMDARQAACLAGLAPVTRQSGKWNGRAFIKGGRANLRQALYMPALVAIRFNPDMKAKYQQLCQAGKPPKVAITAIMRKLIVLANALLKKQKSWQRINA